MRGRTVTLEEMGRPIRKGAGPCPFCGSLDLVLATCKGLKSRPHHRHVRCGECRAFGPSTLKQAKPEMALLLYRLRAPSAELLSSFYKKDARKFFSGRSYRGPRNRVGLRSCVFCGNADIYLYEFGVLNYRIHAMCDRCGAEGPWAVNRQDAKILWNQAHEPIKRWASGFAKELQKPDPGQNGTHQSTER